MSEEKPVPVFLTKKQWRMAVLMINNSLNDIEDDKAKGEKIFNDQDIRELKEIVEAIKEGGRMILEKLGPPIRSKADRKRSAAMKKRWEKWHCERQALMPVELKLERKDAKYLKILLDSELNDGIALPMGDSILRILNKLKRQGIK